MLRFKCSCVTNMINYSHSDVWRWRGGGRLKGVLNSLMLNVVIMILNRIEKNFTARRLFPNVNCVELEINNNVISSDHQVAYPIYNGNSSEQRKYETYF